MANRNTDEVRTLGKGRELVAGHFYPQGGSAPTVDDTSKLGYSVQRTSTGVFTLTFEDTYIDVVSQWRDLQLNSPDGSIATIKSVDPAAKTAVIQTLNSSNALFDPAANANNKVSFGFLFKNSSVGG